jgi:hypothetical protein
VVAVAEAYRHQQLEVKVVRREEPVRLSVGPVLAETDAVATKVAATFSRGYARDYLDLAGILDSGRFSRETPIDLAASAGAGFSRGWFAEVLAAVDRFEDDQFLRCGVDAERVAHVRALMRDWSRELQDGIAREEDRRPGLGQDLQSRGPARVEGRLVLRTHSGPLERPGHQEGTRGRLAILGSAFSPSVSGLVRPRSV